MPAELLGLLFLLALAIALGLAVLVAHMLRRWWLNGHKQVDASIERAFNPLTADVDPAADDPTAGLTGYREAPGHA